MPRTEQPLAPGPEPLTSFANDLRELRTAAGRPTYRELARRTHYSASTLVEAANGKRLPSQPVTLAFVRACGGDEKAWNERWHAVAAELSATAPSAQPDDRIPPYVGLAAFQADDAARFFGREPDVRRLAELLDTRRFVAVFGASGAGKSSLLRAGLIPAVADRGPVVLMTPGPTPLEECAVQLAALTGVPAAGLRAELTESPDRLHLRVRQHLAEQRGDLLLVVDQFEEVFTLRADPAERERFLAALLHAVSAPASRTRLVLGVRADFFGHCAAHAELAAHVQESQYLLGPMTAEALREAVTRPALETGYRLESALLAAVMADTAGQPGVLPLVSHALLETWRRRQGNTLTLRGYQASGGITNAIAQTAEGVYHELAEPQRRVMRQLFLRLTALGEGTEDTKRRVARRELDDSPDIRTVVDRLTEARLVIADGEGLEIVHEALIRCWPRLRDWLTTDRDGLRTHRALTEATETWLGLDRDPAALYRGIRLDQAGAWAEESGQAMSAPEREFLAAAQRERRAEHDRTRKRKRRQRRLLVAVHVCALLSATTAAVAIDQWGSAVHQRDEADYRQALAEADRLTESDPSLAARLLLAVHRTRPDDESVHTRLLNTRTAALGTTTPAHPTAVYQARFRKGGEVLATTGDYGSVRLWDTHDRARPRPLAELASGVGGWLNAVSFSAEGDLLAAAGAHGRVLLWRVSDPSRPVELPQLPRTEGPVYQAAFHPGRPLLATAHERGVLRLWDLGNPERAVLVAERHTGTSSNLLALTYSPDGRTLAAAGEGGTVHLWEDGRPGTRTLHGHHDSVLGMAFTPDGTALAAAGRDGTVRLWRVRDGAALGSPLGGHTGAVWNVAFNAEGTMLVSVGSDGAAFLWNTANLERPSRLGPPLATSGSALHHASFTADGTTLAIASGNGGVQMWSLPTGLMVGHRAPVDSVDVSADGRLTATGDRENTVRLWHTADPAKPRPLAELPAAGPGQSCNDCQTQVLLSPDGKVLVTLTNTSVVRLWDIRDPAKPLRLSEFRLNTTFSTVLALRPDGRVLVANNEDTAPRLWDITNPAEPKRLGDLPSHGSGVGKAVFHPSGKLLATNNLDRKIRLWDVDNPSWPVLRAEFSTDGPVGELAFSPDGTMLAEASPQPHTAMWDISDPSRPRRLPDRLVGHTKAVLAVRWSPDGRSITTASADHTVRRWRADSLAPLGGPLTVFGSTGSVLAPLPDGRHLVVGNSTNTVRVLDLDLRQAIDRICRSTAPLAVEQWRQHLPGLPHRETCPQPPAQGALR